MVMDRIFTKISSILENEDESITYSSNIKHNDNLLSEKYFANKGLIDDNELKIRNLASFTERENELLQETKEKYEKSHKRIKIDDNDLVNYDEIKSPGTIEVDTKGIGDYLDQAFEQYNTSEEIGSAVYNIFSSVSDNIETILEDEVRDSAEEIGLKINSETMITHKTYERPVDSTELMYEIHQSTGKRPAQNLEQFEGYDLGLAAAVYTSED